MVAKCTKAKGSWPDVLPMAMFFLRMTPHSSSSFSPFMLAHGWEPSSPSQVLYQAWVGKNLGSMDVEEWVTHHSERAQQLRDEAVANYTHTSSIRKAKEDRHCHMRTFKVGDQVFYRTPGLTESLEPLWQGPYAVLEALVGPFYRIELDGKSKCVHIRFLKKEVKRADVKRVTTVLDDDSEGD